MSKTSYQVGEQVQTPTGFTSPIGVQFRAGATFAVEIGGETAGRSIALRSNGPDASRVWISDGLFLTSDR